MGTDKRARQKAGREQARIERARLEQQAKRRAQTIRLGVAAAMVVALIAGYAFVTRDSDTTVDTANTKPTTPAPTAANGSSIPPVSTAPAGATITGETPCPAADGSSPRTTTFEKPPPMCIDPAKTYTATVATTMGAFTITLDPKTAPLASNNFVTLARYHYYDGTTFHRVIPEFVVQGGDATGQPAGTGDPGYEFADELPASPDQYQPGTVAMANSGPSTNGSQFYIVLAPNRLEVKYSIFGQVASGFDTTVMAIASGDSAGQPPETPAVIRTVTITEQ